MYVCVWHKYLIFINLHCSFLPQSKSIGDAAYETIWYDLSTKECRILLLVITRSQKRLTITAGRVMDLTLECFTTVRVLIISDDTGLYVIYINRNCF